MSALLQQQADVIEALVAQGRTLQVPEGPFSLKVFLRDLEMEILQTTLARCGGSKAAVCRALGIPKMTLAYKLRGRPLRRAATSLAK